METTVTFSNKENAIFVSKRLIEKHKIINNKLIFEKYPNEEAINLACSKNKVKIDYYINNKNFCLLNHQDNPEWKKRECLDPDTLSIYVGCVASYNKGHIHGMWISCEQSEDKILDDIEFMLSFSPVRDEEECEEWEIYDYENWNDTDLCEGLTLKQLSDVAENIKEYGEAYEAYLSIFNIEKDQDLSDIEDFQERYRGQYDSVGDYACHYFESLGILDNIPYIIKENIDYSNIGDAMEQNLDITFLNGHIFSLH